MRHKDSEVCVESEGKGANRNKCKEIQLSSTKTKPIGNGKGDMLPFQSDNSQRKPQVRGGIWYGSN